MNNLFITAAQKKYRFESSKGLLTVEDLFDLPLTHFSKANLNDVAIRIHNKIKETAEVDFVGTTANAKNLEDECKLDIVKFIIKTKQEALDAANAAEARRAKNARIDELIAKKQDEALAGMTIEELKAMKQ